MASFSLSNTPKLPVFAPPADTELCFLGKEENWARLEELLKPFAFGEFFVVTRAQEDVLNDVRRRFEVGGQGNAAGWYVLHYMLHLETGTENEDLLRRLLALGINPDLGDRDNIRPSHMCSTWGCPKTARSIGFCRPDLSAADSSTKFHTPKEGASEVLQTNVTFKPFVNDLAGGRLKRCLRVSQVSLIWDEFEKSGFPPVARLAAEKEWFAVQNLARRRLISAKEAAMKFNGRDVIEWALFHEEHGLAEELRYFLDEFFMARAVREACRVLPKLETVMDAVKDNLDGNQQSPSSDSLGKDIQDLKEGLVLYSTRVDQEGADLRDVLNEFKQSLGSHAEDIKRTFRTIAEERPENAGSAAQPGVSARSSFQGAGTVDRMHGALIEFLKELESVALAGAMNDVMQDIFPLVIKYRTM